MRPVRSWNVLKFNWSELVHALPERPVFERQWHNTMYTLFTWPVRFYNKQLYVSVLLSWVLFSRILGQQLLTMPSRQNINSRL